MYDARNWNWVSYSQGKCTHTFPSILGLHPLWLRVNVTSSEHAPLSPQYLTLSHLQWVVQTYDLLQILYFIYSFPAWLWHYKAKRNLCIYNSSWLKGYKYLTTYSLKTSLYSLAKILQLIHFSPTLPLKLGEYLMILFILFISK